LGDGATERIEDARVLARVGEFAEAAVQIVAIGMSQLLDGGDSQPVQVTFDRRTDPREIAKPARLCE
jgi:hypothetical protein